VRRLLALSVTTACVVGLTGGFTAGTAAAANSPAPKAAPSAPFTQPVVRSSAVKQLVRKGPAVVASSSHSRSSRQLDVSGPATAIINVTYTGFPVQAHDAFAAAVNIWAHTIHSSVPIEVSADWSDLTSIYGPGVLGAAGPTDFVTNVPNATNQNAYYPIALANAISGTDLLTANLCTNRQISPTGAEISASFNSTESDWYYGTDGNVPGLTSPGGPKVDLESVVLHELGHGLGFTGTYEGLNPQTGEDQGLGYFGLTGNGTMPTIFDTFAANGTGTSLLGHYSAGRPELGAVLRGGSGGVRWNGAAGTTANGGVNPVLYAPNRWEEGSSFSHLDEATYAPNTPGAANALMSPVLNAGEAEHAPGPVLLGMLQDMGWPTTSVPTASPGYYHAVPPVPISRLKSQTGVKAGVAIDVPVTGKFGVPAHITAVVVNVEIKLPTSKGYWTTLPGCKGGPGLPASGDFSAGLSRTGQATLPVSPTGHIQVMSSSAANAVNVDLIGWYSATGELAYHHLQSQQVAAVTSISTAKQLDVLVAGKAGIPTTGVSAVVLKTRISAGTFKAYLAVGPGGQNSQIPSFSFNKGEMVSNFLTVPIGTGAAAGKVHLRITAGKATVSLEAVGWYGPKANGGLVFHPTGPARYGVPLNGQDQIAAGLPGNTQVLLTVHLANPTSTGYLGSSPAGPGGLHGVQEFHPGQPVSGTIITTTNSLGQVRLRLSSGRSPMYVDWLGYYAAT
jgi:hypothetical protein